MTDEQIECPKCGGTKWSTASDGAGSVASVACMCLRCGYVTASVVDLGLPPAGSASVSCGGENRAVGAAVPDRSDRAEIGVIDELEVGIRHGDRVRPRDRYSFDRDVVTSPEGGDRD